MSTKKRKLSRNEIRQAFAGGDAQMIPEVLSPAELARLIGKSVKTVYAWIAMGRLDGAFRKRGKHVLLWRDRVVDLLFNGPEWNAPAGGK
jgi:excisionase family DNA binding protein